MTIATAALYQSRAMKVALMAEQLHFGNDEPSNQLRRLMSGCRHWHRQHQPQGRTK
jgi:hypothetical protein